MSVQRFTSGLAPQPNGAPDGNYDNSCSALTNENAFITPSAHHEGWNTLEYGPSCVPGIPAVNQKDNEPNPPSESLSG